MVIYLVLASGVRETAGWGGEVGCLGRLPHAYGGLACSLTPITSIMTVMLSATHSPVIIALWLGILGSFYKRQNWTSRELGDLTIPRSHNLVRKITHKALRPGPEEHCVNGIRQILPQFQEKCRVINLDVCAFWIHFWFLWFFSFPLHALWHFQLLSPCLPES